MKEGLLEVKDGI